MTSTATEKPDMFTEGKGSLHEMDGSGDTKTTWDPNDPVETKNAKKNFTRLTKQGFYGYRVNRDGSPGEVLREFDPSADAIIMRKQVAGG